MFKYSTPAPSAVGKAADAVEASDDIEVAPAMGFGALDAFALARPNYLLRPSFHRGESLSNNQNPSLALSDSNPNSLSSRDSAISVEDKTGQNDDNDFNYLVAAFRHRDHYEREIDRIYDARPDLLARKPADAELEDDDDDGKIDSGVPLLSTVKARYVGDVNGPRPVQFLEIGWHPGTYPDQYHEEDVTTDMEILMDRGKQVNQQHARDFQERREYWSHILPPAGTLAPKTTTYFDKESLEPPQKPFIVGTAADTAQSADAPGDEILALKPRNSWTSGPLATWRAQTTLNAVSRRPSITWPGTVAHLQAPAVRANNSSVRILSGKSFDDTETEKDEVETPSANHGPGIHEEHVNADGKELNDTLQPERQIDGLMDCSPSTQDFSDTPTNCSDSIESDPHGDLTWLIQQPMPGRAGGSTHPYFELEASAVKKLVDCYYIWQRGGSGVTSGCSAQPLHISEPQNGGEPNSRKRTYEEAQLCSAADDAGPAVQVRRKQVLAGQPRLACHFQKHDPERYPACGIRTSGFMTIAHVKQHLKRNHERNPNYCPRCKDMFDTEAEKNTHILSAFTSPCPDNASSLPEGLSPETIKALSRRVEKDNDLHEQWFTVWDMIFPGVPRPRTCTFDLSGDVHVQALALSSYFDSEGPGIVVSVLRDQGLEVGSDSGQSLEIENLTHRALSRAFHQVFEAWLSQRSRSGAGHHPAPLDNISASRSPALDRNSMLPRTPAATSPAPNGNHNESFVEPIIAGREGNLLSNVDDAPFDASGNSGPTGHDWDEFSWNLWLELSTLNPDADTAYGLEKSAENSTALPDSNIDIP